MFEWVCNAAKGQGSSRYNEGNVFELAFSSWSIFVRSFCREWTSATAVLPYIPQEIHYKKNSNCNTDIYLPIQVTMHTESYVSVAQTKKSLSKNSRCVPGTLLHDWSTFWLHPQPDFWGKGDDAGQDLASSVFSQVRSLQYIPLPFLCLDQDTYIDSACHC